MTDRERGRLDRDVVGLADTAARGRGRAATGGDRPSSVKAGSRRPGTEQGRASDRPRGPPSAWPAAAALTCPATAAEFDTTALQHHNTAIMTCTHESEMDMAWVHPWVGLGWTDRETFLQSVGRTITDVRSRLAASKVEAIEMVRWDFVQGYCDCDCEIGLFCNCL